MVRYFNSYCTTIVLYCIVLYCLAQSLLVYVFICYMYITITYLTVVCICNYYTADAHNEDHASRRACARRRQGPATHSRRGALRHGGGPQWHQEDPAQGTEVQTQRAGRQSCFCTNIFAL